MRKDFMNHALLLGCSTIIHKTYLKGIDSFTQNEHQLGGGAFTAALGTNGAQLGTAPPRIDGDGE